MLEVKHLGSVRGGGNESARFFLHVGKEGQFTEEEFQALFFLWNEEFGIAGSYWGGWVFAVNTRREFAVVPAIIRKADRLGYEVATSQWDVGVQGKISLSDRPADFWQALAMAQAFFKE